MRAVVWRAPGEIGIDGVPDPIAGPAEVLIHVLYAGLCGTDRAITAGEYFSSPPPLIPGHEVVGRVVSENGRTTAGPVVVCDPIVACGACRNCRRGAAQYCEQGYEAMGITRNGGWAELVSMPARNVHAFPGSAPLEVGPLVEPLTCVMGALEAGRLRWGDRVLVIGEGQIGMLAACVAVVTGATVDVVGPRTERNEIARLVGATGVTTAPPRADYDLVLDAVGNQETFALGVESLRKTGRLVLMGLKERHVDQVPIQRLITAGLHIIGSNSGPHLWDTALDLLKERRLDLSSLVQSVVPLEAVASWALGEEPELVPIKTLARVGA
jgi:2-desacetyl-2-hydroxyethyl bacteriochlorophyllide A dehydrogenase